ncbi:hypothetical protein QQX10_07615 [Demequina sp. SYSU T00039]|uniref:Glycosyl transferase family 2 n=1 Tax=Demequina lignilytica TaxID=3051663 RepID=A0AAW7M2U1_9MICO|nr:MULTISPECIES: hypothetical protein [unclassified Demequina]MDN4477615.1 hypothetical protein [Demequina sp. SYSU T00039-1]MDN4488034.1 hypothetical protein [Demequina sp. SYSU T00039]MDN4490474.1 hypothetical protein [Demequina sp. SYSU T00068]
MSVRDVAKRYLRPAVVRMRGLGAVPAAVGLGVANLTSRRSVCDPGSPCVVSLTSYGSRLRHVHLVIESIARGSLRPARLILWSEDPEFRASPPRAIRRLISRGLELRACEDLGPHKKYFPYVSDDDAPDGLALVTSDDDAIYPVTWLAGLARAHREMPEANIAYRARMVPAAGADGTLPPYHTWPDCRTDVPGPEVFPTGVSGVLYNPRMQAALRARGRQFEDSAPRADDIWLYMVARKEGIPIRQLADAPANFPYLPFSQGRGLAETNYLQGGNDRQFAATSTLLGVPSARAR